MLFVFILHHAGFAKGEKSNWATDEIRSRITLSLIIAHKYNFHVQRKT